MNFAGEMTKTRRITGSVGATLTNRNKKRASKRHGPEEVGSSRRITGSVGATLTNRNKKRASKIHGPEEVGSSRRITGSVGATLTNRDKTRAAPKACGQEKVGSSSSPVIKDPPVVAMDSTVVAVAVAALPTRNKVGQKSTETAGLQDILANGCALQKEKGWRAREFGFVNGKVGRHHEFRLAFSLDLAELRRYKSAMSSVHSTTARASNGKFTKETKTTEHDPCTISYLNYAWGVGRNYAHTFVNPDPQKERMRLQRKKRTVEMNALAKESGEQKDSKDQDKDIIMTGEASI